MRPFTPNTPFGTLTINGLSLHTYAWNVIDIRDLYYPQSYRGKNVTIPGAVGERAQPYRVDAAEHQLLAYFTGVCDQNGVEYADRFQGYETNMRILRQTLLTPPTPPSSGLTATILSPEGFTLTPGDQGVQVTGFDVGSTANAFDSPYVWNAVLTLRVPAGMFS